MAARPRLVLASASPRRAALLAQAKIAPDSIIVPDVDETPKSSEGPRDYALRIAIDKAEAVISSQSDSVVLAADTVVACGRRILPKATSDEEVESCLNLLAGRRHRVITAVAVVDPKRKLRTRVVLTQVAFKRLSSDEIAAYVAAQEGLGKAGGYAIQGSAECFVRQINGSYSNVVGLPLLQTLALLRSTGVLTS